jgi:hypothetical protein
MSKSILAWYFAQPNKLLPHGDGRLVRVGDTHTITSEPVLCERGLHASVRPIDALSYATSSIIFRVRLGGTIIKGNDKLCATSRTYLAELNAELVLGEFARNCAANMLHLWEAPDVVKEWLATGNPEIKSAARSAAESAAESAAFLAAESAAWSAAWSAAESAANSAAESAAFLAAESTAFLAAESATWSAAWSAARNAALSAARSAARNAAFNAANSAAENAARSAAFLAAESAQNSDLTAMLQKALPIDHE